MGIFETLFRTAASLEEKKRTEFNNTLTRLPRYTITLSNSKFKRNYARELDIQCQNITKLTSLRKLRTFIAIDTETTGIALTGNYVIEIAAVKFVNHEPVEVFETFVKPPKDIPADATKVNGITNAMVASAPSFSQIIDSLDRFICGAPIVAHNALFDVKHIYVNGFTNIKNSAVYDTLALSRNVIDQKLANYKLATACAHYGIYFDGAHRAATDALAAGMLFSNMFAQVKGAQNVKALKRLIL